MRPAPQRSPARSAGCSRRCASAVVHFLASTFLVCYVEHNEFPQLVDTQQHCLLVALLQAEPSVLEPSRVSSRLRGQAAPSQQQAVAEAQREAEEEENAGVGRTRKGTARKRLTLDGAAYIAPFTLWSIGEPGVRVTVGFSLSC